MLVIDDPFDLAAPNDDRVPYCVSRGFVTSEPRQSRTLHCSSAFGRIEVRRRLLSGVESSNLGAYHRRSSGVGRTISRLEIFASQPIIAFWVQHGSWSYIILLEWLHGATRCKILLRLGDSRHFLT